MVHERVSVFCSENDYIGANRLRFANPVLELEFEQRYFHPKAYSFISKWGLLPGVVILIGFGALDAVSVSANHTVVLGLRFLQILPLILLWVLRKHSLIAKAMRWLYTLYLWWLGSSVLIIIAFIPTTDPVHRAYVVSLPMVVLTMFIAKPHWRLALSCALLLVIEYSVLVWHFGIDPLALGGDWRSVAGVDLVLVSALVIGAITCYVIESGERREFVTLCILQQAQESLAAQKEELLDTLNSLEIANEQLRILASERSQLATIAAHDLKNPIAGIKLQIEILQRYSQRMSQQKIEETLKSVTEATDRMLTIITTFLNHHAIESGNLQVNTTIFDLSEVLRVACKQLHARSATKGISISLNVRSIRVVADQTLVLHIVENLLSNAIKFSPPRSTVEIFLIDPVDLYVAFGVRDQGPGLTEEDRAKLFGAFQRLSAKPTGGESSTGLGLSITKRMVEAMGGRIWCESEPGNGATFYVALPAADEQLTQDTDTAQHAVVESHAQGDSVLNSVEDSKLSR